MCIISPSDYSYPAWYYNYKYLYDNYKFILEIISPLIPIIIFYFTRKKSRRLILLYEIIGISLLFILIDLIDVMFFNNPDKWFSQLVGYFIYWPSQLVGDFENIIRRIMVEIRFDILFILLISVLPVSVKIRLFVMLIFLFWQEGWIFYGYFFGLKNLC